MSLSDCPKCWDTPCTCGHEYRDWDWGKKIELIRAVIGDEPSPQTHPDLNRNLTLQATACFLLGQTLDKLREPQAGVQDRPHRIQRTTKGLVLRKGDVNPQGGQDLILGTDFGEINVLGQLLPFEGRGIPEGTALSLVITGYKN